MNHPYGKTTHPYGKMEHPYGKTTHPYGKMNHPYGKMEHPYGKMSCFAIRIKPKNRKKHQKSGQIYLIPHKLFSNIVKPGIFRLLRNKPAKGQAAGLGKHCGIPRWSRQADKSNAIVSNNSPALK